MLNGALAKSLFAESPPSHIYQKCDWICTSGGGTAQGCEDAWWSSCGFDNCGPPPVTCGET